VAAQTVLLQQVLAKVEHMAVVVPVQEITLHPVYPTVVPVA
jgi:hypothetical protein